MLLNQLPIHHAHQLYLIQDISLNWILKIYYIFSNHQGFDIPVLMFLFQFDLYNYQLHFLLLKLNPDYNLKTILEIIKKHLIFLECLHLKICHWNVKIFVDYNKNQNMLKKFLKIFWWKGDMFGIKRKRYIINNMRIKLNSAKKEAQILILLRR